MLNEDLDALLAIPYDEMLLDALSRTPGLSRGFTSDERVALLMLSIATRLNHAALPLDADLDHVLPDGVAGEMDHGQSTALAQRVRDGFASLRSLPIVEVASLSVPLERRGPAIVLSQGFEGDFVAFRRYAFAESQIAQRIQQARGQSGVLGNIDLDRAKEFLAQEAIDAEARRAIINALTTSFSVLTGGPGSGKTSTIATLLRTLSQIAGDQVYRVALCAPTAKAAVRMSEALEATLKSSALAEGAGLNELLGPQIALDERSGSVHRLLGIRPDDTKSLSVLDHDVIVVDEVSMLEVTLLAKLIEQAPHSHIVLVGDQNQLASVNVGAALRDIVDGCESSTLTPLVTRLLGNYRSTKRIRQVADAMNSGEPESVLEAIRQSEGAVSLVTTTSVVEQDVTKWASGLEKDVRSGDDQAALRGLGEMVVLCATRRGAGSVQWWRERLENLLGSRPDSTGQFRLGAPILVTENERLNADDAEGRLNNGDTGVVVQRDGQTGVLFSGLPERFRPIQYVQRAETAWSMTIHKAQGSEYDEVVVSLPPAGSRTLTRELLYTGVTRARHKVLIVSSKESLEAAVKGQAARASSLAERLRSLPD
jgi:exodeoxyribonuclease V alpha subunit